MTVAITPIPFERVDEDGANMLLVPMLTTSRAVDLFLGDLTRRGASQRTIGTYRWHLDKFCDVIRDEEDVTTIRPDDCRRHLDRWNRSAQGTRAHAHAVLNSFLEWLYLQQRIKRNPLDHVARPRRLRAEDLDVVTVATPDVPLLLAAAHTWTEKLTIALIAYMGPRRKAAALARLRDYNRDQQLIRFREKGRKTIWKPVPGELALLIEAAISDGAIADPDDYLIPPEGPLARKGDRDDRVLWKVTRRVAGRVGVDAHVHALRAAFATFYLEQNPNDLLGLQELMGHNSIETTKVYLRKLDKQSSMSRVRTLSWAAATVGNGGASGFPQTAGIALASSSSMGAGGFEPPFGDSPLSERAGTQHGGLGVDEALLARARESGREGVGA